MTVRRPQGVTHIEQPGYTNIRREGFMAIVESLISPEHIWAILAAYQFAKGAHRNQIRLEGRRYFDHPREVALILLNHLKIDDWRLIVLALMHDIMEDSYLLLFQIVEKVFGSEVAVSLRRLTKAPKDGYNPRLVRFGTTGDWIVKLADRVHNDWTLYGLSPAKQVEYIEETRREYFPLAEQLINQLPETEKWRGVWLRDELHRLCDNFKPPLRVVRTVRPQKKKVRRSS